ncbi:MAG: hypothetical protein Q9212_001585, partial [Teloschistes hypoglaucus]
MATTTISSFQELTGLGRSVVIYLFQRLFQGIDNPDFYLAIRNAFSDKIIAEKNAQISALIHLTGINRKRAEEVLNGSATSSPYDLNDRIIFLETYGEISAETAVTARMRVLTGLPHGRAHSFFLQTDPKGSLEPAILRARDQQAISPHVALLALFKLLTGFNHIKATRVLGQHDDLEQAITQSKDYFRDDGEYSVARLRVRFGLTDENARNYITRPDIYYDFAKAYREVSIDRVMDKAIVDREDACKYLDQHNGNVEQAIQTAQDHHLLQPTWCGINADTRNPPDVHPNTHIIGVLGLCDLGHQRRASPQRDGWMVSDFYLWINVLDGMGKTQKWFTCEDPHTLLAKYGSESKIPDYTTDEGTFEHPQPEGYLQGDPFEERTLVLSKKNIDSMAGKITQSNHGTNLRDALLHQIEKTCKIAEAADEPVLLMAFSHGDISDTDFGGLCIGTNPSSQNETELLTMKLLGKSLEKTPRVRVSMYTTPCYTDNWVFTPELKLVKPTFISTTTTPTQPQPHDEESLYAYEALAPTSMRHADSVYTTAFLDELQKEQEHIGLPDDAEEDEKREYDAACQTIIKQGNRLWTPADGGSTPIFSPEGGHDKY